MGRFTTNCFLRVKDSREMYRVIENLVHSGYEPSSSINCVKHDYIVAMYKSFYTANKEIIANMVMHDIPKVIDCKESVDLFIALARLNDNDDRLQLFIDENHNYITLCPYEHFHKWFNYGVCPYIEKGVWESSFYKIASKELIELFGIGDFLNSIKIDSRYDSINEAKEILNKVYKYKKEGSYRTYEEYEKAPLMVLPHKFHELLYLMDINQHHLLYIDSDKLWEHDIHIWDLQKKVKTLFSVDTSIKEKRENLHFIFNALKLINKI